VAWLFLKLGTIAFGGPAAHTAMMRDELVRRRGWVSDERFVDLIGATNLIPGPNFTELAIHLGFDRARWRGLLAAGACFILPAALIVTGLAQAYVTYGDKPTAEGILYGIVPAVIAIIAHALFGLLRTVVKTVWLGVLTGRGAGRLSGRCQRAGGARLRRGAGCREPPAAPPATRVVERNLRSAAGDLRRTAVCRPDRRAAVAAVRHRAQDRCGVVWQRLRAVGVPARRLRRPAWLDH
jgi:chromate transport protein ChrA